MADISRHKHSTRQSGLTAWWKVIAGDVSRFVGALVALPGYWLGQTGGWFKFVHQRQTDNRFTVFPTLPTLLAWLAALAACIFGLFWFADPAFQAMLQHRDALTLKIFNHVTRVGESGWILYASGIVLLVISLFPASKLDRRPRLKLHDVLLIAYFLFTSVAFSGLLANLFKGIFGRARPLFTPDGITWFSKPFGGHYEFASFPSGHSTTAGALMMGLILLVPRFSGFFLFAAVVIGLSRPVLEAHFPSDVFAGLALGAGFTYLYARSFARKRLLFAFGRDGLIRVNLKVTGRKRRDRESQAYDDTGI